VRAPMLEWLDNFILLRNLYYVVSVLYLFRVYLIYYILKTILIATVKFSGNHSGYTRTVMHAVSASYQYSVVCKRPARIADARLAACVKVV